MEGWVKLFRQIQQNDMYFDGKFDKIHAWIDLILLANYKESTVIKRGIKIEVRRGQIAKSVDFFCERWQWSHPTVEKFFKELESCEQICVQRSRVTNLISIINYEKYQSDEEMCCEQNCEQNCEQIERGLPAPSTKERRKKEEEIEKQSKDCQKKISDIEKRKTEFYNQVAEFVGKYPKETLREFFDYWTETNRSCTKMRFELEKTWVTSKRLARWSGNEKPKHNQSSNGQQTQISY